MNHPYDDIIDMEHHVSGRHPRLSMDSRAAQFAPFAALTGHDAAIMEAARLTETERELTSGEADALNRKLSYLLQNIKEEYPVEIVFFEPDSKKEGGAYRIKTGFIKNADLTTGILEMGDGSSILIRHIKDIKGDCLDGHSINGT